MKLVRFNGTPVHRRLWALVLLMAAAVAAIQLWLPASWQMHCRFHALTGLPCPGCGASRCGALILGGHWQEAALMQPLIFGAALVLVPCFAYAFPALLFNWPMPRIRFSGGREQLQFAAVIIMLILANWAYLLIRNT